MGSSRTTPMYNNRRGLIGYDAQLSAEGDEQRHAS
jgi:hypothetical protein